MSHFSTQLLSYFHHLRPTPMPPDIEVLLPLTGEEAWRVTEAFYTKFYNNNNPRTFILGINPGRFGGGVTGIPFTDPIRLETECGIPNNFPKKQEVSSVFVYAMIKEYGGAAAFYGNYYIHSLYPLALTYKGKNINYYDTKELLEATRQPIVDHIKTQLAMGLRTDIAICWGEGKNYQYLQKLNAEFGFFDKIIPLPHPRFITQYRRKFMDEYIKQYLEVFMEIER